MFGPKQPKRSANNLGDLGREKVTFSLLAPQESVDAVPKVARQKSTNALIDLRFKQAKHFYNTMSNLVQLHNNQRRSSPYSNQGNSSIPYNDSPTINALQHQIFKSTNTVKFSSDGEATKQVRHKQQALPFNRRRDQLLAGMSPLKSDNYENVRSFLHNETKDKQTINTMTGIIRTLDAQRKTAENWNNNLRPTTHDPHVKGSVNPMLLHIRGDMMASTHIGQNRRRSAIGKHRKDAKKYIKQGSLSQSYLSHADNRAAVERFKLAERNLTVDYITDPEIKSKYLGQIEQFINFVDSRLKITFGLFTQEKNDLFFKELQNMINIVFFEVRPLQLIISVGKLIITIMYQYTEYYKCTWCCAKLVKLIENSLLLTAARKREFESLVQLRLDNKSRKKAGELIKFGKPLEFPYQAQIIVKSDENISTLRRLLDLYKINTDSLHYTMQYDEGLRYAYKMLFLALYLNDEMYELQAYDILGREYNEIAEYSRSRYFQDKSKETYLEEPDSISRQVYPEMRRRYNISKMGINDKIADIRDDSPDVEFYENVPLSKQEMLIGLQDMKHEGYFLPFEEMRKNNPFTHPRLENRVRIATKNIKQKNKIGTVTYYRKEKGNFGNIGKTAKLQFNNCTETALLTHKSPNRTLLSYNDHSELRGQDVFKRKYLEVVLKDQAIIPIINEFNKCGLIVQATKNDLSVLNEASKLIDYSAFEY